MEIIRDARESASTKELDFFALHQIIFCLKKYNIYVKIMLHTQHNGRQVISIVILAVDFGQARTGLAVCDPSETLASPLAVLTGGMKALIRDICGQAAERGAEMIVVGHPVNMDGSRGESAKKCEAFAEKLRAASRLPVALWDERLTTVSAHRALDETNTRGKDRKAAVDAVAAVMILEDYLRFRKNTMDSCHPERSEGSEAKDSSRCSE